MASEHDPEKGLWCAVIAQAIDDATRSIPKSGSQRLAILSARDWITQPNRDFAIACGFAGYEPDRIRAMVAPRINDAAKGDNAESTVTRRPKAAYGPLAQRYEFDGRAQTLREWANEAGIKLQTVRYRLNNGMSIGDALTTPIDEQRSRKRSNEAGGIDQLSQKVA